MTELNKKKFPPRKSPQTISRTSDRRYKTITVVGWTAFNVFDVILFLWGFPFSFCGVNELKRLFATEMNKNNSAGRSLLSTHSWDFSVCFRFILIPIYFALFVVCSLSPPVTHGATGRCRSARTDLKMRLYPQMETVREFGHPVPSPHWPGTHRWTKYRCEWNSLLSDTRRIKESVWKRSSKVRLMYHRERIEAREFVFPSSSVPAIIC